MEELKKIESGKLYWHHSLLSNWEKNEEYRLLKKKGWERLLKSVKKHGIKDEFEIDEKGIVYDGNHRLRALNEIISEGTTTAENGIDLLMVPVHINKTPANESQALQIAAEGNGDKDFAIWNKDAIANHKDQFDQLEDIGDLVFDIEEAETFEEEFSFDEEAPIAKEAKKPKEIECPSCHATILLK